MIKAILAVDMDMGIGKNGTLPWPANKEDLKQFKDKTTGHIVVMGSNTWKDPCFPAPLKLRDNYVITSKSGKDFQGAVGLLDGDVVGQIVSLANNTSRDVWIIGGAKVIEQCKDIIEEWHITVIQDSYDCDTFITLPKNLHMVSYETSDINKYCIYQKEEL